MTAEQAEKLRATLEQRFAEGIREAKLRVWDVDMLAAQLADQVLEAAKVEVAE